MALVLAAAAAAALILPKDKEEDAAAQPQGDGRIAPPVSYSLAGVEIVALPTLGENVAVYPGGKAVPVQDTAAGEGSAQTASEDGDAQQQEDEDQAGPFIYRYEGLEEPGALTGAYAALLSTPDAGFYIADETLSPGDAPDFTAAQGSVVLARTLPELPVPELDPAEAAEMTPDEAEVAAKRLASDAWKESAARAKQRLTLSLAWEPVRCTVTAQVQTVSASARGQGTARLSVPNAEEYIQTLSPAAFGLEGTSMSQYRVYVADGSVLVNGLPCIRVNVCREDGRDLVGNYFLSADHRTIYQLDTGSGTVTLLTGSE